MLNRENNNSGQYNQLLNRCPVCDEEIWSQECYSNKVRTVIDSDTGKLHDWVHSRCYGANPDLVKYIKALKAEISRLLDIEVKYNAFIQAGGRLHICRNGDFKPYAQIYCSICRPGIDYDINRPASIT